MKLDLLAKGKNQITELLNRPIHKSIKRFYEKTLVYTHIFNQVIQLGITKGQMDMCILVWYNGSNQHHLCHFLSSGQLESNNEETLTKIQIVKYSAKQLVLIEINNKNNLYRNTILDKRKQENLLENRSTWLLKNN